MTTRPTVEIRPQAGPQEAFLSSSADLVVYGGAAGGGKTWGLLLEPLRHINNSDFGAVIFRRTYPEITGEGGMWDESKKLYPELSAKPNETDLQWTFPSGARVTFAHMQLERDKEKWKGAQIPLIGFDQLETFSETQLWYLFTRNRSLCGVRPYARATANPEPGWLANFLDWWIAEDGYAIKERSGVVRWMVRYDEKIIWADSKVELLGAYRAPDGTSIPPKSVTFILATLYDNKILMRKDPGYIANLMAQPLVERERLLGDRLRGGNWKVKPAAGKVFNRGWFKIVDAVPALGRRVRYWDKAGTSDGGARTAGVLMNKAPDGIYYVEDVIKGQWSAGERESVIKQTAQIDAQKYGNTVEIWVEQEPGSGGKESAESTIQNLVGFVIRSERVTGSKETRAQPFAVQCEAGNVKLLNGAWNGEYIEELHSFPEGAFKDQVDASSGAFNKVTFGSGVWWQ